MPLVLGDGVKWLEEQKPDSLDGIFTDPPWGSGADIVGQENWLDLIVRVAKASETVIKEHGHIMFWTGQGQGTDVARAVLVNTGLFWNALLVVQYFFSGNRLYAHYAPVDYIFVFGRKKNAKPRGRNFPTQVYSAFSEPASFDAYLARKHTCARNLKVVGQVLRDWFAPGDIIADPFAGTDTTGYQAKRLGMECWSFEIDPSKYNLALERHMQTDLFAGQET